MERYSEALRRYAEELAQHHQAYGADEFERLLQSMLQATIRHHGLETMERMSEDTVLKVLRSQVSEVIRLKRLPKLMSRQAQI
ncbi:MAG TPA: hypothetical protein VFV52_09825 [Bacilli bacterium]|nr:hypothetical protein [Bacilli bacterium]